jgi:hypothetical protein
LDAFNEIVRLLPQLDSNQLEQLGQRIKALAQFGGNGNGHDSDESFVLDAIAETLHTYGADYSAVGVMRKSATLKLADGSSFRGKVPGLMQFLNQAHPEHVGQQALLLLGLQFLVLELRKHGNFVTFKTLMAQIHRVAPALDAHFPGYAQAGLLRWVTQRREM